MIPMSFLKISRLVIRSIDTTAILIIGYRRSQGITEMFKSIKSFFIVGILVASVRRGLGLASPSLIGQSRLVGTGEE